MRSIITRLSLLLLTLLTVMAAANAADTVDDYILEYPNQEQARMMQEALAAVARKPGTFEVWVTHMFVLSDLAGTNTSSGEGLVLRADGDAAPKVLARLSIA